MVARCSYTSAVDGRRLWSRERAESQVEWPCQALEDIDCGPRHRSGLRQVLLQRRRPNLSGIDLWFEEFLDFT